MKYFVIPSMDTPADPGTSYMRLEQGKNHLVQPHASRTGTSSTREGRFLDGRDVKKFEGYAILCGGMY